LEENSITTINRVIATHPHQDHIAGLTALLNDSDFVVEEVIVTDISSTSIAYQNFIDALNNNGLSPITATAQHLINLDITVSTQIISPPTSQISDEPNASRASSNSLVTHLVYNDISFLFSGDATHTTENWIISNYPTLDINIMNSPHHGSKYSNTENFIDHVQPELVIFSADQNNQWGHPDPETVNRYSNNNIPTLQTGIDGDVRIHTDGTRCSLFLEGQPEQPCYAGVVAVPEFSFVWIVLLIGMISAILFSRKILFVPKVY